ncbi:MAG: apolipoprotein N-acyltransferase, partial [Psychromonas sp.]|nr:apolipoprotein N-acyltransferase [Psychromonas sp.]
RFLRSQSQTFEEKNKTLLTGIISYDLETNDYHNSIIMLGELPQGADYSLHSNNRYQKHQLLPIGEFVPFEKLLRPLAPYFNLPMSSFQRGDEVQANLQTNNTKLAAALCYEIAFPEQLRKNVNNDTGVLLTLSNDAWFGDSIGPEQHLQIARMRAIEFARPLLRSTNNGVTAIYDSQGRELGRLASNIADVLTRQVQPTVGQTPYQVVGSLPLYLYCLLILIGIFFHQRLFNKTQ